MKRKRFVMLAVTVVLVTFVSLGNLSFRAALRTIDELMMYYSYPGEHDIDRLTKSSTLVLAKL
jgi:hypothetical protein